MVHKHKWQFIRSIRDKETNDIGYGLNVYILPTSKAKFICECGKTKLVEEK